MIQAQRTILLIDDCLEDRETYRRYLLQDSRYTYTILESDYGENGLELCRLIKPDAILLDFLLPDIDGLEFLSELKAQIDFAHLPVVMLTGQGNEAIAVQAMKNGASDYMVKGSMTPESLRLAIHNVVERSHLKRQLEQSEERFRTSVENLLDCFGIYTSIRDQSGCIVDFLVEYVNAAACATNRMTKEEQIGKHLLELLPYHQETGLFDEYCNVVETGKPLVKEVLVYADNFNNQSLPRTLDIRAAKLGDGVVVAWRDITERKIAEEEVRKALAKEKELNELKSRFISIASHEFRTPLTTILVSAQCLELYKHKWTEEKKIAYLQQIQASVKQMNELIEDVLVIEKSEAGKLEFNPEPLDLEKFCQTLIAEMQLIATKEQAINFVSYASSSGQLPDRPLACMDKKLLRHIFSNLLSNAIKYSHSGSAVYFKLAIEDNVAIFEVQDSGIGIPPKDLPRLFESFHRASNVRDIPGTGLGLVIVKNSVDLHGGKITVQSEEGLGTTFTVLLPLNSPSFSHEQNFSD
ncbi:MAG: response regulator [Aphanothece sp. CMT-3BRIN-NPC111]|jgi:signal transduction histidine kinase/CheY-like chemotaxis protein|nr:response regulator [Aphanothece sp. CMT-3BRIN-NPC111]